MSLFADLRSAVGSACRRVPYLVLWLVSATLSLGLVFELNTRRFLWDVLSTDALSGRQKSDYVLRLLRTLAAADWAVTALTVSAAVLLGLSLTLLVVAVEQRRASGAAGAASVGGLAGILLSIGCSACGTLLLPLAGLTGAIGVLPLRGLGFLVLSNALLLTSVVMTARSISRPRCRLHGNPERERR